MKILLTGGSGMVGKNILDFAKDLPYTILSPSRQELNLLNFDDVISYLDAHQPDCIVHAAGFVGGIQANLDEPIEFLVQNTDVARNVILAAKEQKIERLLNIGSSCMYPTTADNPLKETDILTGPFEVTNEAYAIAKLYGLKLCEYIHHSNPKFKYKTIIPCNLYGKYDNFDLHRAHMIPAAINKLNKAFYNRTDSVIMWGDGSVKREFMYAEDLADFIFFAIENFDRMPQILNVGTGKDYSILEYYLAIAKAMKFEPKIEFDLTKPVGMKKKLVDISNLSSFGWKAKNTLKEGLEKTINYYNNVKE